MILTLFRRSKVTVTIQIQYNCNEIHKRHGMGMLAKQINIKSIKATLIQSKLQTVYTYITWLWGRSLLWAVMSLVARSSDCSVVRRAYSVPPLAVISRGTVTSWTCVVSTCAVLSFITWETIRFSFSTGCRPEVVDIT